MEEPLVTPWATFLAVVPASMCPHGRADTGPIGTSTLPNPAIPRGVMPPFEIYIADALKHTLEASIRTIAVTVERCACSKQRSLTHSQSHCWKALNRSGWNAFRTRMAA